MGKSTGDVVRELGLRRNHVVQIVPEEFSAALASVAVKYRKELYFLLRLFGIVWLKARLFEVKHDRYSVFVVVAEDAVMRVGSVRHEVRELALLAYFGLFNYGSDRQDAKRALLGQRGLRLFEANDGRQLGAVDLAVATGDRWLGWV